MQKFKTIKTINFSHSKNNKMKDFNISNTHISITTDEEGNKLVNSYQILNMIGKGSFGTVHNCYNLNDSHYYAIKIINKKKLSLNRGILVTKSLEKELKIHNKLTHPNILKIHEIIKRDDHQFYYLILDRMEKGSLNKLIGRKGDIHINTIWKIFRELIIGLEYLHEKARVIHCDIKPDNLLLNKRNHLKISDFGISQELNDDDTIRVLSNGSPYFMAPELSNNSEHFHRGKPIDIWSSGVTLYYMVFKTFPFYVKESFEITKLYEKIKNDELIFPKTRIIEESLIDLINCMLTKDAEKRITIQELKVHPWVTKNGEYLLEENLVSNNSITSLINNKQIK